MKERTVVFCTCWVGREDHLQRYQRWIKYHAKLFPNCQFILIDDGSTLDLLVKLHLPIYEPFEVIKDKIAIVHFKERLGRPIIGLFPGWWRSFSYASDFAIRNNIDRLIHIESDSYVLTSKLKKRLLTCCEWGAPYCREMMGGETAVQSIPRKHIVELWEFWKAGARFWYGYELASATYVPEYALPIRKYWMDIKGGRFGEDWWQRRIPVNELDYVVNVSEVSGKNDVSIGWKIKQFFRDIGLE